MATSTTRNQTSAVERRARQFYQHLNAHEFGKCFAMIDPIIRGSSTSVTAYQYENALRQFVAFYHRIDLLSVTLEVHLDEPSNLFGNRDFAVGQTCWTDKNGDEHVFQERWVRDGQRWYTRSTGFVTPAAPKKSRIKQRENGAT
jgi:hypothetical protein